MSGRKDSLMDTKLLDVSDWVWQTKAISDDSSAGIITEDAIVSCTYRDGVNVARWKHCIGLKKFINRSSLL